MSWFTNSISVLFGFQTESTMESIVNQSASFDRKTGVWCIKLHQDIKREPIMKFLIQWMHEREFQGIVTGQKTIFFLQNQNNRRCFVLFQLHEKHGKCIFLSMKEGEKYEPNSPTDIFGQSIFTEFSLDLAKHNLLRPQLFNGYPELDTSEGEQILQENQFINGLQKECAIFVRIHKHEKVAKIVIENLRKFHFQLDRDVPKDAITMTHSNGTLGAIIQIGYNENLSLLLHIEFVEVEKEPEPDKSRESSANRDVGTDRHFLTCIGHIGTALAQMNLLRSQKYKAQNLADEETNEKELVARIDTRMADPISSSELLAFL